MSSSSCLRKGLWLLPSLQCDADPFRLLPHMAQWLRWPLILTTAQTGDEDVGWLPGLWGLPGVWLCSNFSFRFTSGCQERLGCKQKKKSLNCNQICVKCFSAVAPVHVTFSRTGSLRVLFILGKKNLCCQLVFLKIGFSVFLKNC